MKYIGILFLLLCMNANAQKVPFSVVLDLFQNHLTDTAYNNKALGKLGLYCSEKKMKPEYSIKFAARSSVFSDRYTDEVWFVPIDKKLALVYSTVSKEFAAGWEKELLKAGFKNVGELHEPGWDNIFMERKPIGAGIQTVTEDGKTEYRLMLFRL
jgi:hypothetical protein